MATWGDSKASKDYSEEELAHMALMASVKAYDSGSESNSYSNEVFFNLTYSEIVSCLTEILEKFQSLQNRHMDLKRIHVANYKTFNELKKENFIVQEIFLVLEKYNSALKSKSKDLEKEIISEDHMDSEDVIKKYDMAFQKFITRNIDRGIMDSTIYDLWSKKKR